MGDNITASTASAPVSGADAFSPEYFGGNEANLETLKAENETLSNEIVDLKAENEALKKALEGAKTTDGGNETAVKVNKKSLFFDHEVLSDSGIVSGKYVPKTEPEYNRLAPFAVEEK